MPQYPLDFLDANWDGSGFDFEVAAATRGIDVYRCFKEIVNAVRRHDSNMGIKSSHSTRGDVSAPTIVPFYRLADLPFNGYVEFAPPDRVTIGGKAECFYTGDETTDFRIASTLAEILVDATNVAERAQFSFGIAGAAGGRARRLLRKS